MSAIHTAIAYLHAHRGQVQPRLDETSYFGFSCGGILTANMTNRWKALQLPEPRAIFLDDPHDGGLTGNNEPALDRSLAGIPSTTKFVCHAGADGVISLTDAAGESLKNASCNAVFPKLGQIAPAGKSLVLTSDDAHGQPAVQAIHGVCAGARDGGGPQRCRVRRGRDHSPRRGPLQRGHCGGYVHRAARV